jgi:hypothetical protein
LACTITISKCQNSRPPSFGGVLHVFIGTLTFIFGVKKQYSAVRRIWVFCGKAEVGQLWDQNRLMERYWIFVCYRTGNVRWGLRLVTEMSHKWLRSQGLETYNTSRRQSYRGRKVCWCRRTSLEGWVKRGTVAGNRRNVNGCCRSECFRISCVPGLSLNVKWFRLRTMYLKHL